MAAVAEHRIQIFSEKVRLLTYFAHAHPTELRPANEL
jgi:hypothetical protein